MADAHKLVTEHIDVWTNAIKKRNSQGRGSSKKTELVGIKRLRELILDLAVRGKLVPQYTGDEPASVLLDKIAIEKDKLVADNKIKKQKSLSAITGKECPFELPIGWQWSRLGSVGLGATGKTPSTKHPEFFDGDIQFVGPGNITPQGVMLKSDKFLTELGIEQSTSALLGDILMVCIGGSIGKSAIAKERIAFNQQINALRPIELLSDYLKIAVSTDVFYQSVIDKSTGSATPIINRGKWEELLVPVAPLAEQRRIVDKVDELMSLCDDLEQQTEESISAHQTLVEVLLATLTNPPQTTSGKADSFQQNWQRIAENFDVLFTTEHSIEQLKQTILQLAVMGKLVPQNLSDEPASVLLKKMDEEKELLIASKKIKKQKQLPELIEAEQSYILPSGWAYSYMQDICSLITDGTHQTPVYSENGRPFVSAQCVKPFVFIPDKCRYVSEEHYQGYIKNRKPEKGDVLLARVGAGIGEAAVIDIDLEFAIYVSTCLLKPYRIGISPDFLVVWLNSPVGRLFSETNTLGKGVSQGNLNLSLIRQFIVGIPPLSEQLRIVAKVNELMVMCEQLKTSLNEVQIIQLKFADTIVAQAVK
jgi:type I restriction enzyme S subunit